MIRLLLCCALSALPWAAAAGQSDRGNWEILVLEEDELFGDTTYQFSYDRASVVRDGDRRTVQVFERDAAPRWQLLRYDCAERTVELLRRKGVGTGWQDVDGEPRPIPPETPLDQLRDAIC